MTRRDISQLEQQIDVWLYAAADWVAEAEILARFDLRERDLRAHGVRPGLLTRCAISRPGGGYRHVLRATLAEWLAFRRREWRAAVRTIARQRLLAARRRDAQTPARGWQWEQDSGQGVMIA